MSRLSLPTCALVALLAAGAAAAQTVPASASASSTSSTGDAADPYIWLEKVDSPEAMDWVRAENKKSLSVLHADLLLFGDRPKQTARGVAVSRVARAGLCDRTPRRRL